MKIGLGQVEFPEWVESLEGDWDGVHTYQLFGARDANKYSEAAIAKGLSVMFTCGDRHMGYTSPGEVHPPGQLGAMRAAEFKLRSAGLFWGWHCEGRWVRDPAAARFIEEVWGSHAENLILYDNGTGPLDRSDLISRRSRLWYTNFIGDEYQQILQKLKKAGATEVFQDRVFQRLWTQHVGAKYTHYPLSLLKKWGETRRTEVWLGINGLPQGKLPTSLGGLDWSYRHPGVREMWRDLCEANAVGCEAAWMYTYSAGSGKWSTLAESYPEYWTQVKRVASSWKNGQVPRDW